jgi:hypothetical protein
MGREWGSGPSRAIKFFYAPAPPPPSVCALKPPSWALVHKTTYAPTIYTARASGRGLGPGNLEFFASWLDAISQGPKNSGIPGPNPLLLALVMDMHASRNIMHGLYKS